MRAMYPEIMIASLLLLSIDKGRIYIKNRRNYVSKSHRLQEHAANECLIFDWMDSIKEPLTNLID